MAKTKVSEWDAVPGNNTDIDSINIAEGCAPSGINNAIRELMSQVKDFQQGTYSDPFNGPVNGTIGATTPAAGAFTTLAASGAVTLSGGTANGVPYLNGSKVLTSGSALTFDGTSFGVGTASLSALAQRTIDLNAASNSALVFKAADTTFAYLYADNTANEFRMYGGASKNLTFYANASEQMRLTSTGLGIGTSSPSFKMDVQGAGTVYGSIGNTTSGSGSARLRLFNSGDTSDGFALINNAGSSGQVNILNYKNSPLAFWTNSTERLHLSADGNLGLGVTPSAWSGYGPVFQMKNGGGLANNTGEDVHVFNNCYYNGSSWRYITSTTASRYEQYLGGHYWMTAPSGTAGNAISFTQVMSLQADGTLLIGTTSSGANNSGAFSFVPGVGSYAGTAQFMHSTSNVNGSAFINFSRDTSYIGSISQNGTTAVSYNTSSDYRLKNITGPITSSGIYIDSLNPVEGTWKADGSVFVGLLAHEVQEVSRTNVATGEKDGEQMQAMDYSSSEIIANMIAELKHLRKRVAELEAK